MGLLESVALVLVGYLLGAIPFGLVLGKLIRGIDIRHFGSGKVGATNTLRTLGPAPSALVFALDAGKAAAAVSLARALGGPPLIQVLAATTAVVGHCWSVYIGFGGGRGVASSVGALATVSTPVAATGFGAAIAVMALTKYASLGSLVGTAVAFVLVVTLVAMQVIEAVWLIYGIAATTIIAVRHRDNIARLVSGTERRLGQSAEETS